MASVDTKSPALRSAEQAGTGVYLDLPKVPLKKNTYLYSLLYDHIIIVLGSTWTSPKCRKGLIGLIIYNRVTL